MKQTQVWCCKICEKTINFKGKSKHIISKTYKHKRKNDTVVKEYEFLNSDTDEVN